MPNIINLNNVIYARANLLQDKIDIHQGTKTEI